MKYKMVTVPVEFDVEVAEGTTDAQVASTLNMVVAVALVKEIGMNGSRSQIGVVKITDWDSGTITVQAQDQVIAGIHAQEEAFLAGKTGYKLQIKCECGHNEEEHEQGGEYAGECKKHCGCYKFRGLPRQAKIVSA